MTDTTTDAPPSTGLRTVSPGVRDAKSWELVQELRHRLAGGLSASLIATLADFLPRDEEDENEARADEREAIDRDLSDVADRIHWRQPDEALLLLERHFPILDGLADLVRRAS